MDLKLEFEFEAIDGKYNANVYFHYDDDENYGIDEIVLKDEKGISSSEFILNSKDRLRLLSLAGNKIECYITNLTSKAASI